MYALLQENRRLRAALEFYQDVKNYKQTGPQHDPDQPAVLADLGERAQLALGPCEGKSDAPTSFSPMPVSQAINDVVSERVRQREIEGFQIHDDLANYDHGALALAGAAYAIHAANQHAQIDIKVGIGGWLRNGGWCGLVSLVWPKTWDREKWWKPGSKELPHYDPRRCLVKAGALIVAEIERFDADQELKIDHESRPAE